MRIKLLILAGSLAAFVVALVFGAEMCAQISQSQTSQSQKQQGEVEAGQSDVGGVQIPNVTEGGVQNVNQNLREIKSGMQEQMDQRRDRLDGQSERSGAEK